MIDATQGVLWAAIMAPTEVATWNKATLSFALVDTLGFNIRQSVDNAVAEAVKEVLL